MEGFILEPFYFWSTSDFGIPPFLGVLDKVESTLSGLISQQMLCSFASLEPFSLYPYIYQPFSIPGKSHLDLCLLIPR